jgi:glycosyltransferase involved in cell wall biosynthesis
MKIWLASYPRSGNTFLRNVLFQCYGLESSTYHHETTYSLEENFHLSDIVKTHLLPHELPIEYKDLPKVYLIRDGRDAVVSMAHHKKDLIDIGTDFNDNLKEIIIAAEGSHFSGWSEHVAQWMEAADIIISYEDLIKDPIKEVEKIRKIYDLPQPDASKLLSFNELKSGNANYGSGKFHNLTGDDEKTFSAKNFRKGKAGAWVEEMNEFQRDLFWNYHGHIMKKMGYMYDGTYNEIDSVSLGKIKSKLDQSINSNKKTYKVLIDASKILGTTTDGVKRYVVELLRELKDVQNFGNHSFHFHIYLNGKIFDIEEVDFFIDKPVDNAQEYFLYERILLFIRKSIKFILPRYIYDKLSPYYRNTNFREKLLLIREKISQDIFYKKILNRDKNSNHFISYDLVHVTLPQHLSQFLLQDIKTLVTVHDVSHQSHPEFHVDNNNLLAEKGFEIIVDKKLPIISVSNSTSAELTKYYKIANEKITTIYEATNTKLFKYNTNNHLLEDIRNRYNIPKDKKYFLCLSTIEPRKNILNTIKAFKKFVSDTKSETILVIAGKKGWKYEELFADNSLQDSIVFTGFVRDRDLSALYTGSLAFCYISHYEGFGLPILEAMSCRVPVICGSNTSQIEILGAGGIAVASNDIEAISSAMQIMSDEQKREAYAVLAWQKSFTFNWHKTALDTLAIYKKVIENN